MATIILVTDRDEHAAALTTAMRPEYSCVHVRTIDEAVVLLMGLKSCDVMAEVFLEEQNVFDLLKTKILPALKARLICFRMVDTHLAKALDGSIRLSCEKLGAHAYISAPVADPALIAEGVKSVLRETQLVEDNSFINHTVGVDK